MTSATLFGWPRELRPTVASAVEVIGVPTDFGNSLASGARFGPAAIRKASLALQVCAVGMDHGDVLNAHACDWGDLLVEIEAMAGAVYRRGSLLVTLGGDHAISYAAIAAAKEEQSVTVVWFDAHTDFCSWSTGDWHNHKQVLRRVANLQHVGRIVQVGHRGITYVDEADAFEPISVITADEACRMSVDELLQCVPMQYPVYISVDIDALDPTIAPGTGHPVPGGLPLGHLRSLARGIAVSRRVIGLDLMEVNPLLDLDGMTGAAAAALIAGIIESPRLEGATWTSPEHEAVLREA